MNPNEFHKQLTDRMVQYLAGELSAEEARVFEQELAGGPVWEPAFRDLESVWNQSEREDPAAPEQASDWKRLQARIAEEEASPAPSKPMRLRWVIGMAAAIALLAAIWLAGPLWNSTAPEIQTMSFATEGKPDSLRLPDGTLVWMNQHGRLTYPQTFAEGERRVTLSGEAFFEVKKDPSHPFVIQTKTSETRVLGTSFNVRARPSEGHVSVSVATGKVSFARIGSPGDSLILTPGQQAVLAEREHEPKRLETPDPNFLAWKTKEMTFEHSSLKEVRRVLENTYGRKLVTASPELDSLRFRGEMSEMSLEQALDFLGLALNLSIEDQDSLILLKQK